jgi:hypothetical protein
VARHFFVRWTVHRVESLVQAASNTIMSHFVAIVFANWLLGVMTKAAAQQAAV